MTSSSTDLLARIGEFCAAGGSVDERLDALVLRGAFPDAACQAAWLALSQAPPAPIRDIQVYDPEIGGGVATSDGFDATRAVSITIVKPILERVGFLVFQASLIRYFTGPLEVAKLVVADLPVEAAFAARGLEVATWPMDVELAPSAAPEPISPTKLVSDYVPDREMVTDLSPWVVQTPPAHASPAYVAWQGAAARRLLGGLVSSALLEGGAVWLQASGPPVFRIRADDPDIPSAWAQLTEAAA
jgi:hypothetical protein